MRLRTSVPSPSLGTGAMKIQVSRVPSDPKLQLTISWTSTTNEQKIHVNSYFCTFHGKNQYKLKNDMYLHSAMIYASSTDLYHKKINQLNTKRLYLSQIATHYMRIEMYLLHQTIYKIRSTNHSKSTQWRKKTATKFSCHCCEQMNTYTLAIPNGNKSKAD